MKRRVFKKDEPLLNTKKIVKTEVRSFLKINMLRLLFFVIVLIGKGNVKKEIVKIREYVANSKKSMAKSEKIFQRQKLKKLIATES